VERTTTLGEEIDAWLVRRRATGGLRERTEEFYERSARIWSPFRSLSVAALRRGPVEDFIARRAAAHPRSAQNELELLKRVLKDARARGQRVDEAILTIPPVRHTAREGRALSVDQLYEFASWFPEYVARLALLAGMVGARQRVWFGLTDDLLDLAVGRLQIPAELAKNRRPQVIWLTTVETHLFREQLLARPAGTPLVFPTPTGKQWTRSGFRERVWVKAVEAASDAAADDSVYEGFTFHHLRHTAASLMALAGMDPAAAAERLGHADGGALFLRRYRHLYEAEKRAQASRLDSLLRAHLDNAWTEAAAIAAFPHNQAAEQSGRTWDRTRDLPRVKRALSR
jgi:integrase